MRHVAPALLCLALLPACGDSGGPSLEELLEGPVFLSVIAGNFQADTIEAMLADPLTVRLTSQEDGRAIGGATVNFVVVEEDCGRPFAGSAVTNDEGDAAERWELGTRAGGCTMEARAVKPDGTPVVYATMNATIEPGEPAYGWLIGGTSTGARDTLPLFSESLTTDRGGNTVRWEPSIVSGPGRMEYVESAQGWWYLASETGVGRIAFSHEGRTVYTGDFSVCVSEGRLGIRLYGPTHTMPEPPCPNGT